MHIAVLSTPPDLSAYLIEMLNTWGLALHEIITPDALDALDPAEVPVVVCPVSDEVQRYGDALIAYARRGGTVVCGLPRGTLTAAAGLEYEGAKEIPLRLRVTAYPVTGLAGELLPIVGRAGTYRPSSDVRVLAYLSHPGRFSGESAGITETSVGQGRIIALAFDLALCVLMLRQGDPGRAEIIPPDDGCARPSHLAANVGPHDAGWIPFADLLSRLFVDLVRRYLGAPVPLLSHLPGDAAGILLYSGDEDCADVAWNDEQLDVVARAGARMNLYIIPTNTRSTRSDVQRYLAHHDVGPHPDLRPLDGHPVAERLAELDRQIRLFHEMFQAPVRSVRHHCTAWAGYLEPVEVMEKLGVRMDGNYFSGTYLHDREGAPYASFGAAMPMRFCQPDGRILNVFQQHTHLSDDVMFGDASYSYKLSPQQYRVVLDRILTDILTRFHTPYAVCIHPSNWVKFSRPQGQELLRQASDRGMPVWSFDQWSVFWDARETWRFHKVTWDGAALHVLAEGSPAPDGLRVMISAHHEGASLTEVRLDQELVEWQPVTYSGEAVALVPIPAGHTAVSVRAMYGRNH